MNTRILTVAFLSLVMIGYTYCQDKSKKKNIKDRSRWFFTMSGLTKEDPMPTPTRYGSSPPRFFWIRTEKNISGTKVSSPKKSW